jgi:NADH:ubiquinone oxidoreductase subunit 3 (subunit A)
VVSGTNFIIATAISFIISLLLIVFTFWGFRTKIDLEKTSIYECGFTPYSQPRSSFDIKFYLVSLLFIVFDVEVLFLFPFALNQQQLSLQETSLILFFIFFIFLGIFYEIKSKVIDF